MTTNGKLKVLIAVLFCFIVILVGMLVYAISISKQDDAASDTSTGQVGAAGQSTQSVQASPSTAETLDLKLYYFDADDYEKAREIRNVTIDKKLYQEDITAAINRLFDGTYLQIQKATVNGNSIVIDLSKAEALKFNAGSANGITRTNILAATILNLPDISQMEVTVEGEAGTAGDHYNFNGVFTKANDGKYYNFTVADNKNK